MGTLDVAAPSWGESSLIAAIAILDGSTGDVAMTHQLRRLFALLTHGESRALLSRLTALPPADALTDTFRRLSMPLRQRVIAELGARYHATASGGRR